MLLLTRHHPHLQKGVRQSIRYPASSKIEDASCVIIDIGPGRGDFLFHLAIQYPQAQIVGIEVKAKRVDKLIARLESKEIQNVTLIQDDARLALPHYFHQDQVQAIHINFPDPWPKRRHAKHRLINQTFLATCHRVLSSDGSLFFVTDVEAYAQAVADEIIDVPGFTSLYPEVIQTTSPHAFPTYFAKKWEREGRKIYYQQYRRTD